MLSMTNATPNASNRVAEENNTIPQSEDSEDDSQPHTTLTNPEPPAGIADSSSESDDDSPSDRGGGRGVGMAKDIDMVSSGSSSGTNSDSESSASDDGSDDYDDTHRVELDYMYGDDYDPFSYD